MSTDDLLDIIMWRNCLVPLSYIAKKWQKYSYTVLKFFDFLGYFRL